MTFAEQIIGSAPSRDHRSEEGLGMAEDDGISDQLAEKIFAYIECEAGRDAPLSPEDEAMVRDLLASDPAAQALADEWRACNRGLEMAFAPYRKFAEIASPEELAPVIRKHMALTVEGKLQEADDLLEDFARQKGHDPKKL